MSKPRKYRKGRRIRTMSGLMREYGGQRFIYHRDKVLHFGWWGSWKLHYVCWQIQRGNLFYAKENVA